VASHRVSRIARRSVAASRPISGQVLAARRQPHLALTETLYPPGLLLARHSHVSTYLTFVVDGIYREGLARMTDTCRPRTIRWLPAGEPHADDYPRGARCLHVEIGPSLTRRAQDGVRPGQLDGAMARWAGSRLYREFHQADDVSTLAIEGLILELLAERARARSNPGTGAAPAWLKMAREMLEEEFIRKWSLKELAARVGVHPVHLCREFRKRYHTTIGDFVRRRRVEHACALLADPDRLLAEVALECGFADQSHFSTVFKRLIGTTAAEFRSTLV
jgi:AraC family transcriptional regulator